MSILFLVLLLSQNIVIVPIYYASGTVCGTSFRKFRKISRTLTVLLFISYPCEYFSKFQLSSESSSKLYKIGARSWIKIRNKSIEGINAFGHENGRTSEIIT